MDKNKLKLNKYWHLVTGDDLLGNTVCHGTSHPKDCVQSFDDVQVKLLATSTHYESL